MIQRSIITQRVKNQSSPFTQVTKTHSRFFIFLIHSRFVLYTHKATNVSGSYIRFSFSLKSAMSKTSSSLVHTHHFLFRSSFSLVFLWNFLGKIRIKFESFFLFLCFLAFFLRFFEMGSKEKSVKDGKKQFLRDIPKGCLAIKVGYGEEQLQRFVIPVMYFNHPLFLQLLKEAEEEFGFDHKGAITIPCYVEEFRYVQEIIDRDRSCYFHHHHHNNHHHYHHYHIGCFGFWSLMILMFFLLFCWNPEF